MVLSAHQRGWQSYGIERGFDGLMRPSEAGIIKLDPDRVRGITHLGGTILGTTNRGNPFRWREKGPDGAECEADRSDDLIAAFQASGFDALVTIGGDGSLKIGYDLWKKGLPVVGVPKTIDNDVNGTDVTFGFDTALTIATEAIDRLHTTAESHDRVMVVEVMGRHAGWIALESGIAGGADQILIPEYPVQFSEVADVVRRRHDRGKSFSIIVVAEGAHLADEGGHVLHLASEKKDAFGHVRLGGIGATLAERIEEQTGFETRYTILGHIQRGGSPTAFDRVLGSRFGIAAVDLIQRQGFGRMVAIRGTNIVDVPLVDAVGTLKTVGPELYELARVFFS